MQLSITDFRRDFCSYLDTLVEAGEPAYIEDRKRRGDPTEAVVVPPELWDEILRVPSVRKRIKEHVAAKQADQQNGLDQAA
ncbi:type II toxin-antitoxin system Phd/YefM family antitoxin [Bounagaea algeriensis]